MNMNKAGATSACHSPARYFTVKNPLFRSVRIPRARAKASQVHMETSHGDGTFDLTHPSSSTPIMVWIPLSMRKMHFLGSISERTQEVKSKLICTGTFTALCLGIQIPNHLESFRRHILSPNLDFFHRLK